MSRIVVIVCDGCGTRITSGALQARAGRVRVSLDVCEACAMRAVDALVGVARPDTPSTRSRRTVARLEADLSRMTRIASEGYRGERDPLAALGAITGRGT